MLGTDLSLASTVAGAAFVLAMIVAIIISYVLIRIRNLFRGASGADLESIIASLNQRTEQLELRANSTDQTLAAHDARIMRSIQSIVTERFDPFQNAGGQQSFSTALLNEHGSGIVLSGFHTRDGVRVYAKEVANFTSARDLTDEERQAIARAEKSLQ